MAKKKTKKEEESTVFDLEDALDELEPSTRLKDTLLKTGFKYYLNHNTVTIKDNTTLQKEFKKFKEGV